MRDNDGRKLDHKTLEQVRIRVVQQVERGAHPEYLASVLGFACSTVFGWMARYREGGLDVLKARTIPGRPQKLSGYQLRQIYTLIVGNDPRQLSFEFALWTREMVRELIRCEFNVKLSVVSVGGPATAKVGAITAASAVASLPTSPRKSASEGGKR
jgi:transposase